MDYSHGRRCERPRKRGRALTYEEKWMVQHVFETVEQQKTTGVILSRHDPYGLTSKYTGVARRVIQFSGMGLHNGPKGGKEFGPTRGLACPARSA
jgi:hypothetical protein